MKIQCNVCEKAEGRVFCFADDAALCKRCDQKVHAANKLATKHQRVALLSTSNHNPLPKCDICQETDGYFFCLEDRALLCRKCDVAIHTLNTLVSSHQRFLLTGVQIGLQTPDHDDDDDDLVASDDTLPSQNAALQVPDTTTIPMSSIQAAAGIGDFVPPKLPFGGGSSAQGIQQWQFDDEFFGLADLNHNYDYTDDYSSKSGSNKGGDSDCSSILRALKVELDADDCLGQVPASSWAVPEISSPPTASGLNWSKGHHNHNYHQMDTAAFVPDVCYSPMSSYNQSQQTLKRRRHF